MLMNYLKITLRNLIKNKLYSFVNIFGLAIGVACFILIGLFVLDELTYDTDNTNVDRIFRINAHYKVGDNRFNMANSPIPLANVIKEEYPEIQNVVRIQNTGNIYVKKGDEYIKEERFYYADSTMFDIFTIEFVSGNPKTALVEPNSVVITDKMAEKYFPGKNPVGERFITSENLDFIVTGVVKPVPHNSHFEFDFLASFNTLPQNKSTNWFGYFAHTYVLTDKGVTQKQLNDKIFSVAETHLSPIVKAAFGVDYREFINSGNDFSFVFVPLKQIHLYSEVFNEFKEVGDINTVYLFSAIAFFILLIACINFINLATAKSTKRANEIGVRKALGSNKIQLVKQFLSESTILCFFAVLFAVMIAELVLSQFNLLTNKELSLNLFANLLVVPGLLIFTILLGVVAGLYPALLLASYRPVKVLQSKASLSNNNGGLRKGLVVFQFATSIILFIGTFVIYNQMEYIKNKNLGYDSSQVLVIRDIDDLGTQQKAFTHSINENPNVINASLSRGLPGFNLSANIYQKEGESKENHTLVTLEVDYDYLDTYKLKMKAGRYFSKEFGTDTLAIILNEAAVKRLNYTDPINAKLLFNLGENNSPALNVIGVVKDFNIQSLKEEIRPAALILLRENPANYLSVKLSTKDIQSSIKYLTDKWREFGQIKPMEYSFYNENFDETYRAEIQTEKIFSIFAILAIIIACLGLFGLAAFTAEQRTKEIGIRKVLGATISNIVAMLSREFLILVIVANLIAWPAAYFIMNKWLEDFAYRTEIGIRVFLLAGLVVLIIALITVSFQAIKAATANPVKSLRYE